MSRRSKRGEQGPPSMEGSWRIVEGEHDSFDTSIAPLSQGFSEGASFRGPVSSGSALPSQLSTVPSDGSFARGPVTSQGAFSLMGSQDSIRDFSRYEGDENLILKEPFRPTFRGQATGQGSEEMQLKMPMVDVFSSGEIPAAGERSQQGGLRARFPSWRNGSGGRPREMQDSADGADVGNGRASRVSRVPSFVVDGAIRVLDSIASAVRILRWPLALLLAICLSIGVFSVSSGLQSSPASTLFSPICRIHGLSPVSLPFCPSMDETTSCNRPQPPVEFQDLVYVQDGFGKVLERSHHLTSLPREKTFFLYLIYEVKRLVSISDVPTQEVAEELHQYTKLTQSLIQQLHSYDVKVGDAIDGIINYERWTFRQISLIHSPPGDEAEDLLASSGGILTWWTRWWPFRTVHHPLSAKDQETRLREAYAQLATHMSLEVGTVLSTAEAAVVSLERGERMLEDISNLLVDSSAPTNSDSHRESLLVRLWTRLTGHMSTMKGHDDPGVLLRRAIDQQNLVAGIVVELASLLQTMQTNLNQLRDRASPQTRRGVSNGMDSAVRGSEKCDVPVRQGESLPRQLDILKAGLDRLEATKDRIRGKEYGKPKGDEG